MNFLLVGPVPPEVGSKNFGGRARQLWSLATSLTEQNCEVEVLATGHYFRRTRKVDDIRVHSLGPRCLATPGGIRTLLGGVSFVRWLSPRQSLIFLINLLKVAQLGDLGTYDVIYSFGVEHFCTGIIKQITPQAKLVISVRSYSAIRNGRVGVRLFNRLVSQADAVVHISRSSRREGEKLGVEWLCHDEVIYNGIEVGASDESRVEKTPTVSFVGYLGREKGIVELLNAWKQVQPHCRHTLKIAGKGRLAPFVEEFIRKHRLRAQYLGFLPSKQVYRLIAESVLLAVPSYSESFGQVYVQAMMLGTPVLGYHGTLAEFREVLDCDVDDQSLIRGVDMSAGDGSTLAPIITAMLAFSDDPGYSHALSRIQQRAREVFATSVNAQQILRLAKRLRD